MLSDVIDAGRGELLFPVHVLNAQEDYHRLAIHAAGAGALAGAEPVQRWQQWLRACCKVGGNALVEWDGGRASIAPHEDLQKGLSAPRFPRFTVRSHTAFSMPGESAGERARASTAGLMRCAGRRTCSSGMPPNCSGVVSVQNSSLSVVSTCGEGGLELNTLVCRIVAPKRASRYRK